MIHVPVASTRGQEGEGRRLETGDGRGLWTSTWHGAKGDQAGDRTRICLFMPPSSICLLSRVCIVLVAADEEAVHAAYSKDG